MSTQTLPPPPKKAPPPPPSNGPPQKPNGAASAPASTKSFSVSTGLQQRPLAAVIYGTGGIGKSELAANITQLGLKVLFLDLEHGSSHIDVARVEGVETFSDMRSVFHSDLPLQYDAIVVDTLTRAEEMGVEWTIQNVPHEKGLPIKSIEDYGFGKGIVHNYETFLQLLGDFDALIRRGKHVIAIAHECVTPVPNPKGEDWIRYEPRLQSPTSGKNSIRHRVKEWCEHLFYIGYDVMAKDGKHLYVSTGRSKMVYTIDTATNTVAGMVEAGQRPWGIALSPDGTKLFTANGPSGDVSIVDLATNQVTKKISVGRGPWGVAVVAK